MENGECKGGFSGHQREIERRGRRGGVMNAYLRRRIVLYSRMIEYKWWERERVVLIMMIEVTILFITRSLINQIGNIWAAVLFWYLFVESGWMVYEFVGE